MGKRSQGVIIFAGSNLEEEEDEAAVISDFTRPKQLLTRSIALFFLSV